jgi:hypothetical protein
MRILKIDSLFSNHLYNLLCSPNGKLGFFKVLDIARDNGIDFWVSVARGFLERIFEIFVVAIQCILNVARGGVQYCDECL